MGLIEGLRRKKVEDETRAVREKAVTEARERERLEEARIENAKKSAEIKARINALNSTLVPEIAGEFASLTGKRIEVSAFCLYFRIDEHVDVHRLRSELVHNSTYFIMEGQLDGSVEIGDTILSHDQANIPTVVERALERAYQNPIKKRSVEHLGGPYEPPYRTFTDPG